MAIVHEKLYSSESLVKIDFKDYIKDLTDSLFLTYKISPHMIKLNKNIDNIFFNVNTAIPCGLIINELVTNSLKHAFPTASGRRPANRRFADPTNEIRRFEDEKSADPQTSDHNSNEIEIELHQLKNNLVLVVSDNGVGLPENIDFTNTESLGLRLVNNLVKQIDGTIELDKTEGTKFTITFKELRYKKRI
jgi:two-component sensor histidine kinase